MIYIVLLIVLALVAAWLLSQKSSGNKKEAAEVADDCCGAHEVCESDSLLSSSDKIEYYNDDELDRFKGTLSSEYSDEAIEEFRDVLYTLKEREVAGWMKSVQLRLVELPDIIREEALMIVEERRTQA
ncbi:phospholipase [Labilibacter sediminis]|nr:phospholipase [Labilibacter sediminis]